MPLDRRDDETFVRIRNRRGTSPPEHSLAGRRGRCTDDRASDTIKKGLRTPRAPELNDVPDTLAWLLDSDPAIRWQALRDLTDADAGSVAVERARVAREGVGARVLASQGDDGAWHRSDAPDWLPTLFTLQLLRATGVDRSDDSVQSAIARLEAGFRWDQSFGAKPFFDGEVEPCINGGALALGAYFGRPAPKLAQRLVGEQLADGGWNCEAPKSSHSSFHTTICVLEGLLEYERAAGPTAAVSTARRRGEEYLLDRRLFRRRSTGEVVSDEFLRFAFPPRYHYDVLRALDYLRAAGASADARMDEAIGIVRGLRQPDGTWLLDRAYDEALALATGETVGEPSRWNTLRALRVLRWHAATRTETATPRAPG